MTDKIAEGSLRHTQKTKAHDRLSKQRSNFAEVREKVARLDLATKRQLLLNLDLIANV